MKFVVVCQEDDKSFIQCVGIKDNFDEARLCAYNFMEDCLEGDEAILSPLKDFEGSGAYFSFEVDNESAHYKKYMYLSGGRR